MIWHALVINELMSYISANGTIVLLNVINFVCSNSSKYCSFPPKFFRNTWRNTIYELISEIEATIQHARGAISEVEVLISINFSNFILFFGHLSVSVQKPSVCSVRASTTRQARFQMLQATHSVYRTQPSVPDEERALDRNP